MAKIIPQDEAFYHSLYKKVKPKVEAMVFNASAYLNRERDEIVKDILQDGLILFLEKYANPKENKANNPAGFYYICCLNVFYQMLRKVRNFPQEDLAGLKQEIGEAIEGDEEVLRLNRAKAVRECINSLNERHQELMKKRFWDDFSVEKVAEILEYSKRTAEVTISRCYTMLRNCLKNKLEHLINA